MSYSTFYSINKRGSLKCIGEQHNGHFLGPAIWNNIFDKYVKQDFSADLDPLKPPYNGRVHYASTPETTQALWDSFEKPEMPYDVKLALVATFDNAWVPIGLTERVCAAILAQGGRLPVATLMKLTEDPKMLGWCFNCTSVIDDLWKSTKTYKTINALRSKSWTGKRPFPITRLVPTPEDPT